MKNEEHEHHLNKSGKVEELLLSLIKNEYGRIFQISKSIEQKSTAAISRIFTLVGLSFAAIGLLSNSTLSTFSDLYWYLSLFIGFLSLTFYLYSIFSYLKSQKAMEIAIIDPYKLKKTGETAKDKKELFSWMLYEFGLAGQDIFKMCKRRGDYLDRGFKTELLGFFFTAVWIIITLLFIVNGTINI